MKIGISGASGQLGKIVLDALIARASGDEIVAISRTPETATRTVARAGDYDKPESLAEAYADLDRLLIIPGSDLAPGVRSRQGVDAVAAAVAAGVKHVHLLSATGTREKSDPAMGAAYWLSEQALLRSNVPCWTILRMNYFAETLAQEAQMAAATGMLPALAENKVAYVSRDDVGAALAGALATEGHGGAIYNLTGPASVSGGERAATLSAVLGKALQFAVLSEEQLRGGLNQGGLPPFIVDAIVSMQQSQAEGAYDIVTGDVRKLAGRDPVSLETALSRVSN